MNSFLKYLIFFSFVFMFKVSKSQTLKSFTKDSQKFYEEINSFMQEADKKIGKALVEEEFGPVWNNATNYNDSQKKQIYDIANTMLSKKLKAFPDFEALLNCLIKFSISGKVNQSFAAWMESLDKTINGKRKSSFTEYLSDCANLFEDNTFYKSTSTAWSAGNSNYTFAFDSLPKIIFSNTNIRCYAKQDSSVIYGTSGIYYPTRGIFEGSKGKVTWQRAGLDVNETFAVIESAYKIQTKSSSFIIDTVLFYNSFFANPLKGKMSDKVLANVTEKNADYPQFESFDKRLKIKNLVDKVNYDGGFMMKGANFFGYGTFEQPAKLTFFKDSKPFMQASALNYVINPDRINADKVNVIFYLNNDSISHPSIQLKFLRKERLLTLIRTDEGTSKSPYYDTFHKLDLYFEALYWKIDDPVIEMGNLFGSTETKAAFESTNYFKMERYKALLGMDAVHPLIRIREYAKSVNSDEFLGDDFAKSIKFPLDQITAMLIDLANKGFIKYDVESHWIVVYQKLYDYILATAGKVDYDVIVFNSDIKESKNATLNLLNYDLRLKGVKKIILSDSAKVVVYPSDEEVTVQKNRNFNCGGTIYAGKLEFFGKEYAFDYNKFQIDLVNVDSCRLNVEAFEEKQDTQDQIVDNTGKKKRRQMRVKNVIEGVGGVVAIDNPYNKSGRQKDYTNYPIYTQNKKSYVFYSDKRIQKGSYKRDNFYFQLVPFVLDSLDNFNTDILYFDGTLVSAGIFADIDEKLKVQKDYSLGFIRPTGGSGMTMYANKAKFTSDIVLNYNGLQGKGELAYVTSVTKSDGFVFCPDSTFGKSSSFINTEKDGNPEVPEANAKVVFIKYEPANDNLKAFVLSEPISMYNKQASLDSGYVSLSSKALTGNGLMKFSGATLTSNLFKYKKSIFDADTSNFDLASMDQSGIAFKTDNVNAHVDFAKREATFKANGDNTFVEFPVNKYVCYMDQFKWYMDANNIELEASNKITNDFVIDTDLNLAKSNFFSVKEDQDSLSFMAPKALYELKTHIIRARQVPFIRVADAKIIPDSGRVVVKKDAAMEPLKNANILANYITQYHSIFDATVNIYSKNKYTASGKYNYVDETKKTTTFDFAEISVDSTKQTYADGKILEKENFQLSPYFDFYGDVNLRANNKYLIFDGNTRVIHDCPNIEKNWMAFKQEINPDEIFIPVDSSLADQRGNSLGAGILLADEPYKLYSTFLSARKGENDVELVSARGFLYFDKKKQEYQLSTKEKLRENSLPGNFVNFNTKSCEVKGNGALNLVTSMPGVKIKGYGDASINAVTKDVSINSSIAFNFFFLENPLEKMAEFINAYPDLKNIEVQKTGYERSIKEILGLEKSDKVISELNLTGTIKKLPEELQSTIYFADVKFKWDAVAESYVSVGELGIASVLKKQIFRYVKGKIQIEKVAGGDILRIYLEPDEANWYFFEYRRGLMQAFSSDKDFNNSILETKEDKRRVDAKKDEDKYMFMLSTLKKRNDFLKNLEE
jgi:hypothetical protein